MKTSLKTIIALILAAICIVALVGCGSSDAKTYYYDESTGTWTDKVVNNSGNGGNYGGSNNGDDGSLAVEIGTVTSQIQYVGDGGTITPLIGTDLSIDTRYTLQLSFVATATAANDGMQYFKTVLTFNDINILNGSIKEAETGKQAEITEIDSATGSTRKEIELSFKIPMEKDAQKQITILVDLAPVDVADNSQMLVSFASDNARVLGSDGVSKKFTINAVTIGTPSIIYMNQTLMWNHVKNATYYKIFVNGSVLTIDGSEYIYDASGANVGGPIAINIVDYINYIPDLAEVKIQAFSTNNNFKTSNYSNAVEIDY